MVVTIYVDQPVAGSRSVVSSGNPNGGPVGHTFISIQQNVGDQIIIRTFGFYPSTVTYPLSPSSPSILGDDSGHGYDVSLTVTATSAQAQSILSFVRNYKNLNGGNYNLNSYNCTDFGIDIANLLGININSQTGSWCPFGSGHDPGDFGEDLRNINTANGAPGTALTNTGSCVTASM
jgi:hypothetical protein